MTREDIIRMAVQCQLVTTANREGIFMDALDQFAQLIAAAERKRLAWTQDHWTEYEHAIASAEREACAKECEYASHLGIAARFCADAIRRRGQQ